MDGSIFPFVCNSSTMKCDELLVGNIVAGVVVVPICFDFRWFIDEDVSFPHNANVFDCIRFRYVNGENDDGVFFYLVVILGGKKYIHWLFYLFGRIE